MLLPVFVIRMIEPATCFPLASLISVGGDAAMIFQHSCQVQQVPGHKSGVSIGEVILGTARTGIEVFASITLA